jgi:hypothetical protein
MPFIEEIHEEEQESVTKSETLDDVLAQLRTSLKIPPAFKSPDWSVESNGTALISWRNSSSASMLRLLSSMKSADSTEIEEHFVSIIQIAVPFIGAGGWVKSETREYAKGKPT